MSLMSSDFRTQLAAHFDEFRNRLATASGDWVVKGFIDVYRNVYTISVDTKVVSKVIELMLFPIVAQFATRHGYRMILSAHQNHYPDITFVAEDGTKIALDLKSTYRTDEQTVNGVTLGAFTGYFRQRASTKNTTFPYGQYSAHYVLGVIYSRNENENVADERQVYRLEDLESIESVVGNFLFLLHEKWQIAGDRPGSGNTKNIGSVRGIQALLEGTGVFAAHGPEVFDNYWTNYMTEDMARAIDSAVPYHNLGQYLAWRKRLIQ